MSTNTPTCPSCSHPEHDGDDCLLFCGKCLWIEQKRWRRGTSYRYIEALNYKHALLTSCPCGVCALDLNMDCQACLYRHYWWAQAGFLFNRWHKARDERSEYACPLCPAPDGEAFVTPGCEACQLRLPAAPASLLPVEGTVYNNTSWCPLCGAPEALYTPGCYACANSPHERPAPWQDALEASIEAANGDVLIPPNNPLYEVQRPDTATLPPHPCPGCGVENHSDFTLDCEYCYRRHYSKYWLKGLYTPYESYFNYIALKEEHKVCTGQLAGGTPCGTPTLCYREGCASCKNRWNRWKGGSTVSALKPAFPTPNTVIEFHKQLRISKEIAALNKVTIFPQVDLTRVS